MVVIAVSSSGRAAAAIGAGALLFWIIPSVLVALRAGRDGFPFWPFLLVGLFLTWPVALTVSLIFGARAPLVRALRDSREP